MITRKQLRGTVLKAAFLIIVYACLCYFGYWMINNALGSAFWFTGWAQDGSFVWSSDLYWVPLFFVITLGAVTLLAWMLRSVEHPISWHRWIKVFMVLILCRFLFALTTWDNWLIWPWLYGNPYQTWLPKSFNSLAGYTIIETALFAAALWFYLLNPNRRDSEMQPTG